VKLSLALESSFLPSLSTKTNSWQFISFVINYWSSIWSPCPKEIQKTFLDLWVVIVYITLKCYFSHNCLLNKRSKRLVKPLDAVFFKSFKLFDQKICSNSLKNWKWMIDPIDHYNLKSNKVINCKYKIIAQKKFCINFCVIEKHSCVLL